MRFPTLAVTACLALLPSLAGAAEPGEMAGAQENPAAPALLSPHDGEQLPNPIVVRVRLPGMPMAGMAADHAGMVMLHSGHAHLFIDSPPPEAGMHVPVDERHKHLMHGEDSEELVLPPGKHTLQAVLASSGHQVGDPPVASQRITVEVLPKSKP